VTCRCDVPRDEASSLGAAEGAAIPFPAPRHEVRLERDIRVPMRDGTELATDLYMPVGAGEKLGTILIRTQYGKSPYRPPQPSDRVALDFAGQGYAVAVQELRGLFDSGGAYALGAHDAEDGYDTLSWIAAQPWSSGRVATYGCSSLGITQVLLAQLRHPAHVCAIAQGSGGAIGSAAQRYRHWDVHRGGALEIGWTVPWFHQTGCKDHSRPEALAEEEYREALWTLPVRDILDQLGSPPTDWEEWISHEPADPWWSQFGFLEESSEVDVPTLFVNSWYDVGAADALHQRRLFSERGTSSRSGEHQYALLSPSTHCGTEKLIAPTVLGERELGDARLDCWRIYLDWFECWLEERPERIEKMPRIRYFTMGRNEWRDAPSWPPPETAEHRLYLRSGGAANTRLGNGLLSHERPEAQEPTDSFLYDPADPVPTLGWESGQFTGARDYQEVELREDVLCFTSEPLERGLEVSGFVAAVLYVSSSARDTDFFARLLDVYPDGRSFDLVDGNLRARYRDGFDRPKMMEPDGVYEIEIDLDATSNWFAPGHRIRLEITSSAFPRFDRNLNTGGRNWDESEWVTARNTVHHSVRFPSHLRLSVREDQGIGPAAPNGLDDHDARRLP
jgi:uncharacterized protein